AEALNEINGPTSAAYEMINAVRARARAGDGHSTPSTYPADLKGISQAQFRDAVLEERAIEFGIEGQRWIDLVRTNRMVSTMKKAHPEYPVQEKHNLFPIPVNEIKLNSNLTQNKGW
ncbi:MAG: RagB/SusD family nutrient uptake outer membrane protein, partial [Sphingobacterium sp.]